MSVSLKRELPEEKFARVAPELLAELTTVADWYRYGWKRLRRGVVLGHLARNHVGLGVNAYFVQGDLQQLKQHFHVASVLYAYSVNEDGGPAFELDTSFLVALLSDSPKVIKLFSTLKPSEFAPARDDPRQSQFYAHMFQLVLQDDRALLREKIALAARKAGKRDRGEFAAGQDLYSLLLARDKAGLEARLDRRARIKSVNPWVEDFIAGAAMVEAKLCWLKGIPVQINNPLIPMALLPVQPLAHYDDVYDFLQPGWKPPLQGALGKLIARLWR